MSTKHPARSARQTIGAASVAAFVGAAVGIATSGHNGSTQPAGASQTPVTTQPTNPFTQDESGGWGATTPDNNGDGFGANGNNNFNGFDGSTGGATLPPNGPLHSQSGAS